MRVRNLTWPEYDQHVRTHLNILPIGVIEPHGKHLPIATCSIIAEYFAKCLEEKCSSLILPTIEYGHMTNPVRMGGEFPGNINLLGKTLWHNVHDILSASYREGARRFFIIHAGYSNVPICNDAAVAFITTSPDARIISASWWDFVSEDTRNCIALETGVERRDDNHAAMVETSLMMFIAPETVRKEYIIDDTSERRVRHLVLPMPRSLHTQTGVVYRATHASAAIGKRVADEIVGNMVNSVSLDLLQTSGNQADGSND